MMIPHISLQFIINIVMVILTSNVTPDIDKGKNLGSSSFLDCRRKIVFSFLKRKDLLYKTKIFNRTGLVSSAALVGAICGQLFFGWIADRIGRKKGEI